MANAAGTPRLTTSEWTWLLGGNRRNTIEEGVLGGAGSIVPQPPHRRRRYRATRLQAADQAELPAWREEHNTSRLRAQEELPYGARRRRTGAAEAG